MKPNKEEWNEICQFIREELEHMTLEAFIAKYGVPDTGTAISRPASSETPARPVE